MTRFRFLTACLVVALLAACGGSPATQFYTLSSPTTVQDSPAAVGRITPVTVGDVNLPRTLDRQQIVRREGENRVQIADLARWASPLDAQIRQVLTTDLDRQLPAGSVVRSNGTPADATIRIISLDIDKFDSDLAGNVTLDVEWSVISGNPYQTTLRRNEHITTMATNPGYGAMSDAMSRAVADLSTRIATSLPR